MNPSVSHAQAYFLVGPTAAGKTAVAQRLAESMGADILSADSMLVYRGMDIGTAKPSPAERSRVRYWGLDLVEPSGSFSVARFIREARHCFESALERGVPVIIAGGTGLYIKALLNGLDELPNPSPDVRARWQLIFERDGIGGLQSALAERNPAWFQGLADPANSRRLMRALELIESGFFEPPRSWGNRARESVVTGIDVPREILVKRIERRVQQMYAAGLLEETRALMARYGSLSGTAAGAIGYAEATSCLQGMLPQGAAMQLTIQRTRQLAKRQMTWFRHQINVSWITMKDTDFESATALVAADWQQHGPQSVIC
ncbi:MAG: tRNA (adenosine(37)-N6)-dimethylallyltransferase MiaA [bacterium]